MTRPVQVLTVVGARPQFIKAAAVSRQFRNVRFAHLIQEEIVHTGQHYDDEMSASFFRELGISAPSWNLNTGGKESGLQIGEMVSGLDRIIAERKPDCILIYGDTNSTLAGALSAARNAVPLAHVEAGLRSFRRGMAEEVNRVVADRLSDLLFCPTPVAVQNLKSEGRVAGVHLVGDVMYDVFLSVSENVDRGIPQHYGMKAGEYVLATVHRAENTDDPKTLENLFSGLGIASRTIPTIMPLHPRTRRAIEEARIDTAKPILLLPPLPYRELVALALDAAAIATDSGGLQKEAYFAGVPCITLRDETEWTETVASGWNRLVPPSPDVSDPKDIAAAILESAGADRRSKPPPVYGDGNSSGKIVEILSKVV